MPLMTRKIFQELARIQQRYCISIYVPTERAGENKQARIAFKNKVREVISALQDQKMPGKQIIDLTRPLDMLQNDTDIWRHMSDGLAVFLGPGKFAYSTFPVHFQEYAEVNNTFYLLPLMPVFNGDGQFFILALSLNKVSLFEGTRDEVTRIGIEGLVPQSLLETTGEDYHQKALQFRSGQTGEGTGMYHGHGEGKDYKKDEIIKHLREVNKSLTEVLQGYDAPLIVAGVDNIFALYRKVNTYGKLFPENISGNPDEDNMEDLHQKAWALVKDHFFKHRTETLKHYDFLSSKGRTSSDIEDIVHATLDGRIDTLFVEKGRQIRGRVTDNGLNVQIESEQTADNYCLLDKVARDAFLQGARVYLLDKKDMPGRDNIATATLRF